MGNKEDMKAGLSELLNRKPASKKNQPKPENQTQEEVPSVTDVAKRPGRRSRMENVTANDYRTSLVVDRNLYQQIIQIAASNGLSIKDVMNTAMRSFIDKYEEKHGPVTLPESKISADELI